MSTDQSHEQLLGEVLNAVVQNNQQVRPGSPLAELKEAIEKSLRDLPPLEFEEFTRAVNDTDAPKRLVAQAPQMIGWDAEQIVEWVEQLAGKLQNRKADESAQ